MIHSRNIHELHLRTSIEINAPLRSVIIWFEASIICCFALQFELIFTQRSIRERNRRKIQQKWEKEKNKCGEKIKRIEKKMIENRIYLDKIIT